MLSQNLNGDVVAAQTKMPVHAMQGKKGFQRRRDMDGYAEMLAGKIFAIDKDVVMSSAVNFWADNRDKWVVGCKNRERDEDNIEERKISVEARGGLLWQLALSVQFKGNNKTRIKKETRRLNRVLTNPKIFKEIKVFVEKLKRANANSNQGKH